MTWVPLYAVYWASNGFVIGFFKQWALKGKKEGLMDGWCVPSVEKVGSMYWQFRSNTYKSSKGKYSLQEWVGRGKWGRIYEEKLFRASFPLENFKILNGDFLHCLGTGYNELFICCFLMPPMSPTPWSQRSHRACKIHKYWTCPAIFKNKGSEKHWRISQLCLGGGSLCKCVLSSEQRCSLGSRNHHSWKSAFI